MWTSVLAAFCQGGSPDELLDLGYVQVLAFQVFFHQGLVLLGNGLQELAPGLKCNAVPIQLPIGAEETFRGIIDLVKMKAEIYYDDLGVDIREEPIPEDMVELAEEYRGHHWRDAPPLPRFRG